MSPRCRCGHYGDQHSVNELHACSLCDCRQFLDENEESEENELIVTWVKSFGLAMLLLAMLVGVAALAAATHGAALVVLAVLFVIWLFTTLIHSILYDEADPEDCGW